MSYSKIIEEYNQNIQKENKKIVIDVDGVVATVVKGLDYSKAKPIKKNIHLINDLKKSGVKIVFFTARDMEQPPNTRSSNFATFNSDSCKTS